MQPQQQKQQQQKKSTKSMANETSTVSAGADRSDSVGALSSLTEKAPELIQDVVQYLENNWGLKKIEKIAAAVGVGSTLDLSKIAGSVNWEGIKRRVSSKPAQAAAIAIAVVGVAVLARQMMTDDTKADSGSKLHH